MSRHSAWTPVLDPGTFADTRLARTTHARNTARDEGWGAPQGDGVDLEFTRPRLAKQYRIPLGSSETVGTARTPNRAVGNLSHSQQPKPPPLPPPSPMTVLREFADATTLHGIRYIAQRDASLLQRVCWVGALVTCAVCATLFVTSAWDKYRLSPTSTSVESTMYPLWKLAFPAITICAASNIKEQRAEVVLLEFLGASRSASPQLRREVRQALRALAKFRFPFYQEMDEHLTAARDLLPRLDLLNATHFVLQVMPTCEEMFHRCLWQGRAHNCCILFQLQRFEGGFCYSFNSLTSEKTSHCLLHDAEAPSVSRQARRAFGTSAAGPECEVRRNSGSGVGSGLEVFLRHPQAVQAVHRRHGPGYQIILHDSTNYPQLGRGLFISTRIGTKASGSLRVTPTLTETAHEVRWLPPADRQCYFPDERQLNVNAEYTMDSCLLECRLDRLQRACACVPYFFSVVYENVPICNMTQLSCVLQHSEELRVPRPPPHTAGFNKASATGPDCLHCLPTCFDRSYTAAASTITSWDASDDDYSAYVDIFYDEMGAIKYRRDLVVGSVDLIVSLGGIASLFLGVSLLSGAELLFFAIRLLKSIFHLLNEWYFPSPSANKMTVVPACISPSSNASSGLQKQKDMRIAYFAGTELS